VATAFNYRVDIPQTLDFIDDVINSLKRKQVVEEIRSVDFASDTLTEVVAL
jgi:hypothetical protein